jgi:hypothetical protein
MSHYHNERDAFTKHTKRCTRNMSQLDEYKMHYENGINPFKVTWPTEERINNIGQNGPTGEHYMNKYQRKLTSPLMVWDRDLDETETEVIIDVYDVLDAFNVSNPATAHAIKKLLCTGSRGAKDWETDLQEAIDSLERAKSFPPVPF